MKKRVSLPVFSFPTTVHYYCPDGYVATSREEADEHGYRKAKGRSFGWDHGDAFATFDYRVLPVIKNFSMVLEKRWGGFTLDCCSDGERVMLLEVWYTSRHIENGKLKPLVGTADAPYNYIDQGVDFHIFERDGYVMVLSAEDWENGSDKFTGFRVKAEEFYEAWDKMPFPEPYR